MLRQLCHLVCDEAVFATVVVNQWPTLVSDQSSNTLFCLKAGPQEPQTPLSDMLVLFPIYISFTTVEIVLWFVITLSAFGLPVYMAQIFPLLRVPHSRGADLHIQDFLVLARNESRFRPLLYPGRLLSCLAASHHLFWLLTVPAAPPHLNTPQDRSRVKMAQGCKVAKKQKSYSAVYHHEHHVERIFDASQHFCFKN